MGFLFWHTGSLLAQCFLPQFQKVSYFNGSLLAQFPLQLFFPPTMIIGRESKRSTAYSLVMSTGSRCTPARRTLAKPRVMARFVWDITLSTGGQESRKKPPTPFGRSCKGRAYQSQARLHSPAPLFWVKENLLHYLEPSLFPLTVQDFGSHEGLVLY